MRTSESRSTRSSTSNRIDAQCFSPSALQFEHILAQLPNTDKLNFLTEVMIKGAQQNESEKGDIYYVSIKHIQGGELVAEGKTHSYSGIPVARRGDLLLAITGATIGKIGIVSRYDRLTFSGDMLAIRSKTDVDPYYLLAFLSNRIGKVQLQRWITGSTNGHLAPRDVRRVVIPRLGAELESRIAALTKESIEKVCESESLLEQAKRRVEELIEESIAA